MADQFPLRSIVFENEAVIGHYRNPAPWSDSLIISADRAIHGFEPNHIV